MYMNWESEVRKNCFEQMHLACNNDYTLERSAHLLNGGLPHLDPPKTRCSIVADCCFKGCKYCTPMQGSESAVKI